MRPLVWILAGVFAWSAGPTHAQPPAEIVTRAAVVGYASNVEAFPHYRCRFKTTYGVADTEGAASAARGTLVEAVESVCVVDGDRELIEIFGATESPKPTAADVRAAKGGPVYAEQKQLPNQKFLRRGKASGGFMAGLNTLLMAQADDGTPGPLPSAIPSPLHTWFGDRGERSPDRLLTQPSRYPVRFLGSRPGTTLVGIGFDLGQGIGYETWHDTSRGYLPVEYQGVKDGKRDGKGVVSEAKEFRPGRWFPMRRVSWGPDLNSPDKWSYCEVVVTELEVEKRPTTQDFSTVLPANTMIHRDGDPAFFKLKQDERVSPEDLDELFEKLEKSKTDKRMDTAIEHKADRPAWWVWPAAVGGAILILGGGYLWWRKWRLARRASP